MTAREVLDGIRGRLTAATPGPWELFASDEDYPPVDYSIITSRYGDEVACFDNHERKAGEKLNDVTSDATFIAAAPTDVARLVAAMEAVLGLTETTKHTHRLGGLPIVFVEDVRAAVEAALKEDPQ